MRFWVRLLPLFVVVWLARKCEVISIQGQRWYLAFEDVIVKEVK